MLSLSFFTYVMIGAASAHGQSAGVDVKKPTKVRVVRPSPTLVVAPPAELVRQPQPEAAAAVAENKTVEWGGSVDYRLRTDLADRSRPRLYVHTLDFSYGLSHVPSQTSVSVSSGVAFESVGNTDSEILVNSNEAELFVNNVNIALSRAFVAQNVYRITASGDNEFPTSPDARREGYNSITSLGLDFATSWFDKKLGASLSTGLSYIWNSYRYSPATGDLNKQMGWKNTLGLKYKVWRGWALSASAGAQYSSYLDGTTDRTYRTSVGTGYSWSRFSISLGYSNGTYLNQEDATLWFIDEYRRTASLRMLFQF